MTHRELDESLAQMEAQILHEEGSYIKETPCGNVIRGFDSFHDTYVVGIHDMYIFYWVEAVFLIAPPLGSCRGFL